MSKGRQYRERLQTQLVFVVNRRKFKTIDAANTAIREAREVFMKTGESIPGVKIIGKWRNPDRNRWHAARWKSTEDPGQSLSAFWQSLGKGRGALR